MRKIEIRTIDKDIKLVYVDDEYTGLNYLKRDMNAMLDELVRTQAATLSGTRSRSELLAELVSRSLSRCNDTNPLAGGPLTPEELAEAARLVGKSCKRGWFF